MESIVRNVRDIDNADREVLEHVVGCRLDDNQQLIIRVVNKDTPSISPTDTTQLDQQIPEWWRVYEGLSEEEVDRLDQAIRQRANLTRAFE